MINAKTLLGINNYREDIRKLYTHHTSKNIINGQEDGHQPSRQGRAWTPWEEK